MFFLKKMFHVFLFVICTTLCVAAKDWFPIIDNKPLKICLKPLVIGTDLANGLPVWRKSNNDWVVNLSPSYNRVLPKRVGQAIEQYIEEHKHEICHPGAGSSAAILPAEIEPGSPEFYAEQILDCIYENRNTFIDQGIIDSMVFGALAAMRENNFTAEKYSRFFDYVYADRISVFFILALNCCSVSAACALLSAAIDYLDHDAFVRFLTMYLLDEKETILHLVIRRPVASEPSDHAGYMIVNWPIIRVIFMGIHSALEKKKITCDDYYNFLKWCDFQGNTFLIDMVRKWSSTQADCISCLIDLIATSLPRDQFANFFMISNNNGKNVLLAAIDRHSYPILEQILSRARVHLSLERWVVFFTKEDCDGNNAPLLAIAQGCPTLLQSVLFEAQMALKDGRLSHDAYSKYINATNHANKNADDLINECGNEKDREAFKLYLNEARILLKQPLNER